jgi:hypothetical protein
VILISLDGGSKTQRNLTEDAIRYFVAELLPRKRSLLIDVSIRNILKEGMAGCCEFMGKNEFKITLHHRGHLYDYISYLAHEMVHLKQYATKELGPKETWKGKCFANVAYSKQPWEKEAWGRQHALAKMFIHEKLGLTLIASKDTNPRSMKTMNWDSEMKYLGNIAEKEANGDYETAARQI